MKEKLTNNWVLKVLAFFFAVLLWLGVINMTDPLIVKTITNIPIEVRNEQVLTNQGKTYTLETTGTVDINVRQTQWDQVSASNITLYVDMEEWYPNSGTGGTLPIHMKVSSSVVKEGDCTLKTTVAKLETDTLGSIELAVEPQVTGEPQDGYKVMDPSVSPETIRVEGPSSVLNKLEKAVVSVDVNGQTGAVDAAGPILLYDKNGDRVLVSENKLTMSAERAQVHLEIWKSITVPVVLGEITGKAAEGYRFSESQQTIQNLEIFGLKTVLSKVNSITIDSDKLDVNGATEDVVLEFDLKDYLPEGVNLQKGEETKMTVTLKIEKLEQRSFTLNSQSIALTGMRDWLDYKISADSPVTVTVEGLKEDLDQLEEADLNAQLNVAGLGTGTYQLSVTTSVDSTFQVKEVSRATVIITEKSTEAPSSEEGEGQGGESSSANQR